MNEIINNFLLGVDNLCLKRIARLQVFTYSTCGPFTKKRIQKIRESGYSRYMYQNELLKFDFNVTWIMEILIVLIYASDKILWNTEFNFDKNSKFDGYQRGIASTVCNFFDKKTSGRQVKNENMSDKQLAEESHK